jgi:hypothetical protein
VGFQLLFNSVIAVIKSLRIFLNIVGNYRYTKVFKLLVHLGAKACIVILLKALCARNLSLLRVPSCLIAVAVHKISIEFPFKLSRNFKGV